MDVWFVCFSILATINGFVLLIVGMVFLDVWCWPYRLHILMDKNKVRIGTFLQKYCKDYAPIETRHIPIEAEVAMRKNGVLIPDCPNSIIVRKRSEIVPNIGIKYNTEIEFFAAQSMRCEWHNIGAIRVCYDLNFERICKIIVDSSLIRWRGGDVGINADGWPKYINSIVMAHLETLKHSPMRKYHTFLIFRILKKYGENIFQGA